MNGLLLSRSLSRVQSANDWAAVAADKENISCEYVCCLFKAKAPCLCKVIPPVCTHSKDSHQLRESRRETCEYQAGQLSSDTGRLPLFPRSASVTPPPYKQFASLVMPWLILYGHVFCSPSLSLFPYVPDRRRRGVTCKKNVKK